MHKIILWVVWHIIMLLNIDCNNGVALSFNSFATFAGMITVNGGGIDIDNNDDIRLRFDNASVFKAGLQVATTSGDMIAGSAVNDFAIRANENMLFATGGNTERMRIDSSGNVGIGTTSPDTKLHIEGNLLVDAYNVGEDNGIFLREGFLTINQPSITVWDMSNSGASPDGLSINANDGIRFRENGGEVARFKDGNLGIGTTSPDKAVHVISAAYEQVKWSRTSGVSGYLYSDSAGAGIYSGASFSQAGIYLVPNTSMDFRVNGSQRMYINSSGRVGIGTTNPGNLLDVRGDTDITGQLVVSHDSNYVAKFVNTATSMSNNNYTLMVDSSSHTSNTSTAGAMSVDVNSGGAFITGQGKIGIGTSTIARGPLHVHEGSTGYSQVHLTNSSSGSTSNDGLTLFTNGNDSGIMQRENSYLLFGTNDTERWRIESDGDILHTDGNLTMSGGTPFIVLSNTAETECGITMLDSADAGQSAKITYDAGSSNLLKFYNNSTNVRMVINNSGNVGIGTTSPQKPLHIQTNDSAYGSMRIYRNSTSLGEVSIGFLENQINLQTKRGLLVKEDGLVVVSLS